MLLSYRTLTATACFYILPFNYKYWFSNNSYLRLVYRALTSGRFRRLRPNGRANMSRAQTDRRPNVLRQDGRAQTVAPKVDRSRPDVVHR
jgi:hypothetical protein